LRGSPQGRLYERLEPYDGKLSRTVLRGEGSRKAPDLPGSEEYKSAMSVLKKIHQRIIDRDYFMSSHAEEEMLDDDLERKDIENAILKDKTDKKMTQDERGTRYRIEGPARDGRLIHVICRFREDSNLIIITVYAL